MKAPIKQRAAVLNTRELSAVEAGSVVGAKGTMTTIDPKLALNNSLTTSYNFGQDGSDQAPGIRGPRPAPGGLPTNIAMY